METPDAAAERLRKLLLVTDAALAHLSLEDLLDELLTRIREILDADTAAFLMLDERANELVARAAKGLEEEVVQGVRIPVGGGFAGRIADERHVVAVDDVDHADVLNPILREKGIKSLLGAPLLARGRVLGVVHVGTLTPRHFDAEDAELLQRAAERAALGVERALLHDELRRLDQVREQFVARASHELRTPATAVYGAAATLDARAGELHPDQVRALQRTLHEQSARLVDLLEKLLDLSRLDAHAVEVNPERLQLHERLSTIVEGFPDSSEVERYLLGPLRLDDALVLAEDHVLELDEQLVGLLEVVVPSDHEVAAAAITRDRLRGEEVDHAFAPAPAEPQDDRVRQVQLVAVPPHRPFALLVGEHRGVGRVRRFRPDDLVGQPRA